MAADVDRRRARRIVDEVLATAAASHPDLGVREAAAAELAAREFERLERFKDGWRAVGETLGRFGREMAAMSGGLAEGFREGMADG